MAASGSIKMKAYIENHVARWRQRQHVAISASTAANRQAINKEKPASAAASA